MSPIQERIKGIDALTISEMHRLTDIEPKAAHDAIAEFAEKVTTLLASIWRDVEINGRGDPRLVAFGLDHFEGEPLCVHPIIACFNRKDEWEYYLYSDGEMRRLGVSRDDRERIIKFSLGRSQSPVYYRSYDIKTNGFGLVDGTHPGYFILIGELPIEGRLGVLKWEIMKRMESLWASSDRARCAEVFQKMRDALPKGAH